MISTPLMIMIASILIVAIVFVIVKMKPAPPCPTCASCPTCAACPTCASCPTAPPCPTCAACPTCPPMPLMGTWDVMIPDSSIPMKLSISPGPSLLTVSPADDRKQEVEGRMPAGQNIRKQEIKKRMPADGGGELIYASEPGQSESRPAVLFRNGKIYMIVEGLLLSPASSNTNPSEYIGDWFFERDSNIVGFTMKRNENGDYVLSVGNRDIMTYVKKTDGSLTPTTNTDPRIGKAEFVYDKTLNKSILAMPVN